MDPFLVKYGGYFNLRVPEGLPQLLHDISLEVLRHQPKHLYSFIADYLQSVFDTRDAALEIENMMQAYFEELGAGEHISANQSIFPDINRFAAKIQAAFRGYRARKLLRLEKSAERKRGRVAEFQHQFEASNPEVIVTPPSPSTCSSQEDAIPGNNDISNPNSGMTFLSPNPLPLQQGSNNDFVATGAVPRRLAKMSFLSSYQEPPPQADTGCLCFRQDHYGSSSFELESVIDSYEAVNDLECADIPTSTTSCAEGVSQVHRPPSERAEHAVYQGTPYSPKEISHCTDLNCGVEKISGTQNSSPRSEHDVIFHAPNSCSPTPSTTATEESESDTDSYYSRLW